LNLFACTVHLRLFQNCVIIVLLEIRQCQVTLWLVGWFRLNGTFSTKRLYCVSIQNWWPCDLYVQNSHLNKWIWIRHVLYVTRWKLWMQLIQKLVLFLLKLCCSSSGIIIRIYFFPNLTCSANMHSWKFIHC